jgi:hypothetical protein
MWWGRRMERISLRDRVKNKVGLLHRVNEKRSTLDTIKRRKAKWIGYILRRNCLLKLVIEGKIQEDV